MTAIRLLPAFAASILCVLNCPAQAAEPKLENGMNLIEVPAIREGLSVHNLFQSNMAMQRDKPVRVWGWAEPGESVT